MELCASISLRHIFKRSSDEHFTDTDVLSICHSQRQSLWKHSHPLWCGKLPPRSDVRSGRSYCFLLWIFDLWASRQHWLTFKCDGAVTQVYYSYVFAFCHRDMELPLFAPLPWPLFAPTAQKRCLARHFFRAVGLAKFGGEKRRRKKREKLKAARCHTSI